MCLLTPPEDCGWEEKELPEESAFSLAPLLPRNNPDEPPPISFLRAPLRPGLRSTCTTDSTRLHTTSMRGGGETEELLANALVKKSLKRKSGWCCLSANNRRTTPRTPASHPLDDDDGPATGVPEERAEAAGAECTPGWPSSGAFLGPGRRKGAMGLLARRQHTCSLNRKFSSSCTPDTQKDKRLHSTYSQMRPCVKRLSSSSVLL